MLKNEPRRGKHGLVLDVTVRAARYGSSPKALVPHPPRLGRIASAGSQEPCGATMQTGSASGHRLRDRFTAMRDFGASALRPRLHEREMVQASFSGIHAPTTAGSLAPPAKCSTRSKTATRALRLARSQGVACPPCLQEACVSTTRGVAGEDRDQDRTLTPPPHPWCLDRCRRRRSRGRRQASSVQGRAVCYHWLLGAAKQEARPNPRPRRDLGAFHQ